MTGVRRGWRENRRQFDVRVVVSAFAGAMAGLEREALPLLAEEEFGPASRAAILSFIASFGPAKALANVFAGRLGARYGRKHARGAGLPVPFLVMFVPSGSWIVWANVLLGVNQGPAWSMTVIMKIDRVGALTACSGVLARSVMRETLPRRARPSE